MHSLSLVAGAIHLSGFDFLQTGPRAWVAGWLGCTGSLTIGAGATCCRLFFILLEKTVDSNCCEQKQIQEALLLLNLRTRNSFNCNLVHMEPWCQLNGAVWSVQSHLRIHSSPLCTSNMDVHGQLIVVAVLYALYSLRYPGCTISAGMYRRGEIVGPAQPTHGETGEISSILMSTLMMVMRL